MMNLLSAFLSFFILINTLGVSEGFSSEAGIHEFLTKSEKARWQVAEHIRDFASEAFPQLHLKMARADLTEFSWERSSLPIKKEDFSDFTVEGEKVVIWDPVHQKFLFEQGAGEVLPIASITKLMTALVFLDHNPGWDHIHEITDQDRVEGGRIYVFLGDKLKTKDLFSISLVASANTSTMALVHSTGMTEEEFVKKMNLKAEEIGLVNTKFKDVVGLSPENLSTPREVARLAQAALDREEIREATLKEEYQFSTEQGRSRTVLSTRSLSEDFPYEKIGFLGGKTGYIPESGYCFVGKFHGNEQENDLISVVLGAEDREDRFNVTQELVDWTFNNYQWRQNPDQGL